MLPIPDTEAQRAEAYRLSRLAATSPKKKLLVTTRPVATPHRNGDSGDDDDAAAVETLPVLCRFRDLVAAKVATNWPQLLRMIDQEGFPEGIWLSSNIRAWEINQVRRWLAARPTARKKVVLPYKHRVEA
jgi:predicted DNA-binding transcriptional regulator AlpA